MAKVIPGRFTAQTDEPFVVFLIGMRINKFFAFRKWIPVARAMGPMLSTLYQHPEKGFLGAEYYFNLRGPVLIQYWRSFEDLEKFARDKSDPHLSAWRQFNKSIGSNGSVGIWHETYLVFGLASATKHVPAVGRRETARRRLGGENEPAIASPAQPTLVSQ